MNGNVERGKPGPYTAAMADPTCPNMSACPLYALFAMESSAEFWKVSYCRGQFTNCARYKLSSRGERVPATLLPNGTSLGRPK